MKQELGIAGKLAHTFLNSKLTPLFIAASLAIGAFAIAIIPREEEPQILVPMLDITTAMPGASPAEVEERVTLPIENLVHQISGVEYVYSTSSPGQSLVIVRFLVGTPQEDALIKVYSKLYSNFDRMPPGVSQPIIKARSIDDVPILALTLWGEHYNGYQLRAIAAEMQHNIRAGYRCLGDDDHRRPSAHYARAAQHGEAQCVWPVADGHRRASAGRQCHGAGGQLCGEQSGSPRGCGQYLHQPRGFGSCGGGRGPRAAGLSAGRCRADRRWPCRSGGLCGLRHNHRRRISTTAVSGGNHHRGQTQGHQRHRHRQRRAPAASTGCRA